MLKGMSQMPNRFADGWTYGELSNSFAERSFRCSIDCAQYLDSITHRRTVLANDDCRNSCSNSYEKWRKTNEKRCNRVKSRFFSESSSDLTFAKKKTLWEMLNFPGLGQEYVYGRDGPGRAGPRGCQLSEIADRCWYRRSWNPPIVSDIYWKTF